MPNIILGGKADKFLRALVLYVLRYTHRRKYAEYSMRTISSRLTYLHVQIDVLIINTSPKAFRSENFRFNARRRACSLRGDYFQRAKLVDAAVAL